MILMKNIWYIQIMNSEEREGAMKKIGIIILIIILVSLTISLFNILMFSIQHNKWNWFMSFVDSDEIRKEEYIRKEEKIDIKDIEKELQLLGLNLKIKI